MHDGTTSVGVIEDALSSAAKKKAASAEAAKEGKSHTLTDHYLAQLRNTAPGVMDLLSKATLISKDGEASPVKSAADYSYAASSYAGDHFRIVGDAAGESTNRARVIGNLIDASFVAFIDPFFSSGLHLALTGALSASASISAALRGDTTESEAARYHDQKVGVSYTRCVLLV